MSSNSSGDLNKAFDDLIVNLAALARARKDDIGEELRKAQDLNDANKYVRDIGSHLSRKEAKVEVRRLSTALKQLQSQKSQSEKVYEKTGADADLQRAQRAGDAADRVKVRRDSLEQGMPPNLLDNFGRSFSKFSRHVLEVSKLIDLPLKAWSLGETIKESGIEVFASYGLGGFTNQRDMRTAEAMQKEQGASVAQYYDQLRNLKDEKEYDSTRENLLTFRAQLQEERDSKWFNETAQKQQLDGTIAQVDNLLKQSNLIDRSELVKKGQATRDASVADEIRRNEAIAAGDTDTVAKMKWMDTYNRMLENGVSEHVAKQAANAETAMDQTQSQPTNPASYSRMEVGGGCSRLHATGSDLGPHPWKHCG